MVLHLTGEGNDVMDLDALLHRLGIVDVRAAQKAELEDIAHRVENSTVASDLAVLRSRALAIVAHLESGAHEFLANLANRVSELEGKQDALAAKHEALEEQVTAPPPQPLTQPDATRQAPDDAP